MSRLATLCTAAAISLTTLGLGACGDAEPRSDVQPEPPAQVDSGTGSDASTGGAVVTQTTPTCAELRLNRVDYDELYERLGCSVQRSRLCSGLTRSSARYDDYRCKTLRSSSAKRKAAAKRRAAAKKKAAAKRRATARKQAAAKKVAAAKSSSGSSGSASSSASSRPSSGSSSSSSSRSRSSRR